MQLWDDLVATALIGTERRPLVLGAPPGPLGDLLGALVEREPESALLSAAGVLALHRRVGRRPAAKVSPLVEPCPPEVLPPCGPGAAQRLSQLLTGEQRELLAEWLTLVATARQRAPAALLPALLTAVARHDELHNIVAPVLGESGRWLAAQRPEWQFAVESVEVETTWQTGAREARLTLLRRLRQRDPARARALLEATWNQEQADDRPPVLGALCDGLSLDDEPLLEVALDDRRKPVRQQATSLLRRVPDSGLVRRMIERVEPLLTYTPSPPRRLLSLGRSTARLEVRLPASCDASMIRDGVEPRPPANGSLGERAWWLWQLLRAIPPSHWCQVWSVEPAPLLSAARRGEWGDVFLRAWAEAALAFQDVTWAEQILASDTSQPELINLLSPEQAEQILLPLVRARRVPFAPGQPAFELLSRYHRPWSLELGRAVVNRLRDDLGGRQFDYSRDEPLRRALTTYAHQLPVALAPELETGWRSEGPSWSFWEPAVIALQTTLRTRHEMLEEINR
jgi:hypothetical protein